ncbi:MAG: hypothetical protein FWC91_09380 [Defluviitaleaceae bacterium]|nr:hypothetical protein [Defluviitaleaceae bacterium]
MLDITENAMLFKINKTFPKCKTSKDLYDATRGIWKVSSKKDLAKYAFAVYQGEVKKVYKITLWESVTPELYEQLNRLEGWSEDYRKCWMFVGEVDELKSEKYKSKNISRYLSGRGTPINYVNC